MVYYPLQATNKLKHLTKGNIMQTVKTFSGSTAAPSKGNKFNWADHTPGKIYKAILGTDYTSHKGFLVSMSRWANETGHTVERYVADNGESVEFRFTPAPTPIVDEGI